jgi:hypothetical protein
MGWMRNRKPTSFPSPFFKLFYCLGLLLTAIPQWLFAQHPDNYFPPDKMKKDLLWLEKKILQYHPSCLDSLRADSVKNAFEEALYESEKPMQELQFLRLLRRSLLPLRCGHTTAIPSKSFYSYYQHARPKPLFPIQVYYNPPAGMFVRFNGSNDGSIREGDKLITINQETTESLAEEILQFLPSDGYHQSFKQFHLSLNFPTYYLFVKGPSYAYESGIIDSSGRFSSHVFSLRSQGKSKSAVVKSRSVQFLMGDDFKELSVLQSNPSIACLTVYGFGGSTHWYEKAFKEIEKRDLKMLILDLRGNSGGSLFNASELLQYLLPDTFSMAFYRKAGPITFEGKSNMSLLMRLTLKRFSMHPDKSRRFNPSCVRIGNRLVNRNHFKPKKKYNFKGKLVVLMDGGTFSAASWVASVLRKKHRAKLLGDESGGGARGCNAMIMPTLTLPETKMRISLPLFHIDHEMGKVPFRGLIPDYRLQTNLKLKIKGIDPELEFLARNLPFLK